LVDDAERAKINNKLAKAFGFLFEQRAAIETYQSFRILLERIFACALNGHGMPIAKQKVRQLC